MKYRKTIGFSTFLVVLALGYLLPEIFARSAWTGLLKQPLWHTITDFRAGTLVGDISLGLVCALLAVSLVVGVRAYCLLGAKSVSGVEYHERVVKGIEVETASEGAMEPVAVVDCDEKKGYRLLALSVKQIKRCQSASMNGDKSPVLALTDAAELGVDSRLLSPMTVANGAANELSAGSMVWDTPGNRTFNHGNISPESVTDVRPFDDDTIPVFELHPKGLGPALPPLRPGSADDFNLVVDLLTMITSSLVRPLIPRTIFWYPWLGHGSQQLLFWPVPFCCEQVCRPKPLLQSKSQPSHDSSGFIEDNIETEFKNNTVSENGLVPSSPVIPCKMVGHKDGASPVGGAKKVWLGKKRGISKSDLQPLEVKALIAMCRGFFMPGIRVPMPDIRGLSLRNFQGFIPGHDMENSRRLVSTYTWHDEVQSWSSYRNLYWLVSAHPEALGWVDDALSAVDKKVLLKHKQSLEEYQDPCEKASLEEISPPSQRLPYEDGEESVYWKLREAAARYELSQSAPAANSSASLNEEKGITSTPPSP